MSTFRLLWIACAMTFAVPSPIKAEARWSEVVVFGDSTVDVGNLHLATDGLFAGPPYFPGRFSNGPVWVEVLATRLAIEAPTPSLAGGTGYAWGAAQTGDGLSFAGTPNLGTQVGAFLRDRGGFTGDEVIVVAAGANDILWRAPYSPRQIARNIAIQVERLAAAGGRHFLVPTLPAYGQAPLFRRTSDEARLDALAREVNGHLDGELRDLEARLPIAIGRLDIGALVADALQHPEEFRLTNVTTPACPGGGIGLPGPDATETLVPNPDEYLWWDSIHWTRVIHERIGEWAVRVLLRKGLDAGPQMTAARSRVPGRRAGGPGGAGPRYRTGPSPAVPIEASLGRNSANARAMGRMSR